MRDGVGLVNGYKLTRHDPWHRICIGWLYNRFARALFGIALRDIDCDFRLMRRGVLRSLDLRSDTGSICVELVRGIELSACGVVEVGRSPPSAAARPFAVLPPTLPADDDAAVA